MTVGTVAVLRVKKVIVNGTYETALFANSSVLPKNRVRLGEDMDALAVCHLWSKNNFIFFLSAYITTEEYDAVDDDLEPADETLDQVSRCEFLKACIWDTRVSRTQPNFA